MFKSHSVLEDEIYLCACFIRLILGWSFFFFSFLFFPGLFKAIKVQVEQNFALNYAVLAHEVLMLVCVQKPVITSRNTGEVDVDS